MSFEQLPDEIINQLLSYVAPGDILASLQLVSRRLYRLSDEPLLWRHHCLASFRFWHPSHDLQNKLQLAPSEFEWKGLFALRDSRDSRIAELFDEIIATKVSRLRKIEEICLLGYDAKDFLLRQCHTDDTVEDVLARRYYASTVLDSMHKGVAIEEWRNLRASHDPLDMSSLGKRRLERALGAFDMFVLHDQAGDFDDISSMLDDLASRFRDAQPTFDTMTTRQKAVALNQWLRANNLTGLRHPDRDYRNLRNCLLGQALRHEEHESIPITSSAIFCCVAERFGMAAHCCAFPSHVHAVVTADQGQTLDSVPVEGPDYPRQKMYLDPYGCDDEVPAETLHGILARIGWHTSDNQVFLAPVPLIAIVIRTARNIQASTARLLDLRTDERETTSGPSMGELLHGSNEMNARACNYAAAWASLMVTAPNSFEWRDRLNNLLQRFSMIREEDSWLVKKFLWPLTGDPSPLPRRLGGEYDQLRSEPWDQWLSDRSANERPPLASRRDLQDSLFVPWKVGQVFRHQRYGWIGVVVGWLDPAISVLRGQADPGRAYFRCLNGTHVQSHIIDANSIEPITDSKLVDENMLPMAGKYFKRFDRATCLFVSNIKEEFPDD